MPKKLGGNRTRTDDSKLPDGYPIPCSVLLNSEVLEGYEFVKAAVAEELIGGRQLYFASLGAFLLFNFSFN